VEADTRPLELYIALKGVAWGLWYALSGAGLTVNAWPFLLAVRIGGWPLWCVLFLAAGTFQVLAIHYSYPRWRRHAAFVATSLWAGCAWAFVTTGVLSFAGYMAAVNALACVWILFHRHSVA
jgi:hypothetical protein